MRSFHKFIFFSLLYKFSSNSKPASTLDDIFKIIHGLENIDPQNKIPVYQQASSFDQIRYMSYLDPKHNLDRGIIIAINNRIDDIDKNLIEGLEDLQSISTATSPKAMIAKSEIEKLIDGSLELTKILPEHLLAFAPNQLKNQTYQTVDTSTFIGKIEILRVLKNLDILAGKSSQNQNLSEKQIKNLYYKLINDVNQKRSIRST